MAWAEVVVIIKDIIVIGVAITGSVVAVKGLSTWRQQLHGNSDYELSRRLLVSLFKYRAAIDAVRYPAMWVYEMAVPPDDEAATMTESQKRFYGSSKAYQARWEGVQTARTNLTADLFEAEALWGTELEIAFNEIFDLEHELFVSIRHYLELQNPDTDESMKEAIKRIDRDKRDVMYDLEGIDDEYKHDFKVCVIKIEKVLKPKLARSVV